jgi:hypothetical protein
MLFSSTAGLASVMMSEDEPEERDPFNQLHELARIEELRRRNTLCLPHLRSVYPVESFETSGHENDNPSEAVSMASDAKGSGKLTAAGKRTNAEAQLSNISLDDTLSSKRKVY